MNHKKRKTSFVTLFFLTLLSTLLSYCYRGDAALDNCFRASAADILLAQTTTKRSYYVSPKGSDSNSGTKSKPWKNINYAVSIKSPVKAGDTVVVQQGVYTELINLAKSGNSQSGAIKLKASGNVILRDPDANNGGFGEGVIYSEGQGYWTIEGFRIEKTSWAGISLRDANNMIVKNNHTYETGASGIIILPKSYYDGGELEVTSKDIQVLSNTVERANWRWKGSNDTEGTQEALSIWGVNGFNVANNLIKEGNREGIDIKVGSRNGFVNNNTITGVAQVSGTPKGYNGGAALYIDGNRASMFNIDVCNNTIFKNTADAIVIADETPDQGDVYDIRVYNNVVYENGQQGVNGGNGILIGRNVRDVEVVNNTIAKNVQGISIDGSYYTGGYQPYNILVRNNIFADSTYRNGFIQGVNNLILDRNLFTDKFTDLYEGGQGIGSLTASNNIKVPSVGFLNLGNNDFHLSSVSAAIDAGSSEIGTYAQFDKDGVRRNHGAGPDIGAYEY